MRRNPIIVATLVLVATTAACTGPADDPARPSTTATATASSTPTLDPAEAARQKNIDDATATLVTFVDLDNDVAQAGYVDWMPLNKYLSGDLRPAVIAGYESFAENGLRQVGEYTITEPRVADYQESSTPGSEAILLEVCMDLSQADTVQPDGSSIVSPGQPTRQLTTYRMMHEEDGRWTVTSSEKTSDEPC
jgi:hypothetical protein